MVGPSMTLRAFRGNRIFPFILQQVSHSMIGCDECWVLVPEKNTASIRGIEKAGAKHVGDFVQRKWFWGCFRSTKYYPDKS